jgi:S1-C subfamily serine protease
MQFGSGMTQLEKCGKQRQSILQRPGARHKKRKPVMADKLSPRFRINAKPERQRLRTEMHLVSLRRVVSISIVCFSVLFTAAGSCTRVVFAQDLAKAILPITQLKWIGLGAAARFGTGFCLDRECRLIGTNYHVAVMARPHKINGQEVIHRYLATGPDDDGATLNEALSGSPLRYTLSRDLAIFDLRRPLPHYHGMAFSLNDLQIGQQVDIYAYPAESINPIRNLVQFHGAFKGEMIGVLLAFDYSLSKNKAIRPGASGGLVIDSKTQQVVGVLSGIARDNEAVAVAVPTQSLADFVSKVQPWLAESLFPSFHMETFSPTVSDLYPKFVPAPSAVSIHYRPDEPAQVKVLREKAQLLADGIATL